MGIEQDLDIMAQERIASLEASLAERERECERLRAWKESATLVESEWDAQAIATMLGGIAGDSCRRVVAVKVPRLIARAEAAESALAAARERAQMAYDCLSDSEHWKTEQSENQCMRHLSSLLNDELASLRARDDGRVERVRAELSRRLPGLFQGNEIARERARDMARAVLAAADRMEP